jgi:predicted ribosomally synthesized peptide with SipW-like signal peptide
VTSRTLVGLLAATVVVLGAGIVGTLAVFSSVSAPTT